MGGRRATRGVAVGRLQRDHGARLAHRTRTDAGGSMDLRRPRSRRADAALARRRGPRSIPSPARAPRSVSLAPALSALRRGGPFSRRMGRDGTRRHRRRMGSRSLRGSLARCLGARRARAVDERADARALLPLLPPDRAAAHRRRGLAPVGRVPRHLRSDDADLRHLLRDLLRVSDLRSDARRSSPTGSGAAGALRGPRPRGG